MPRDGRSEAQPERVQESRDGACIKLKTKWAALEVLVGNPKRCQLSPHRPQSRDHMKLPQSDKLVVEPEKIADYLLNPSHRYGGSKARFFGQHGFEIAAWELLAQALREHGRTYEIARERQTGFGPRFIVEGDLNTPSGHRPRVRTVWQLDDGTIAPRLMTAYPLEAQS